MATRMRRRRTVLAIYKRPCQYCDVVWKKNIQKKIRAAWEVAEVAEKPWVTSMIINYVFCGACRISWAQSMDGACCVGFGQELCFGSDVWLWMDSLIDVLFQIAVRAMIGCDLMRKIATVTIFVYV